MCVCLPLVGCVFGPRRVGPEGLSGYDTDLRSLARLEDFDRALELTEEGADDAGDDLLRVLHRAVLLRYAGQYEESNRLLQQAELEIEDRYTKSVSRAALSLLTNDRALAYNPPRFERFMIHYFGAVNYLALGEPAEAAVEARRLSDLLVAAEENGRADPRDDRLRRSLHYFAGLVFETAGEWNEAAVAYRNAWDGWDLQSGSPQPARPPAADTFGILQDAFSPLPPATVADDEDLANGLQALTPAFLARDGAPPPDSGEVVVLLETGFVAHRVERTAAVPIFRDDVSGLKSSEEEGRYDAGLCVAARTPGVRSAVHVDGCNPPIGKSLYVVTASWPEMRRSSEPVRSARVVRSSAAADSDGPALDPADERPIEDPADGRAAERIQATAPMPSDAGPKATGSVKQSVPTRLTIDLSAAAISELDARIGGIVAKSVARAVGKYLVVDAISDEVKEDDRTLGEIVGLLGNVAAVASERADTRSWHLLPGTIRVARLSVPSGTHSFQLELHALSRRGPIRIDLGEVHVRPGSVSILPVRSWP